MLFNEGNHLDPEDIAFSAEEMDKIESSSESLFKAASSTLSNSNQDLLKHYWEGLAESSRGVANTLSAFCAKDIPQTSEGYIAVKEAMVKALILEKATARLAKTAATSSAPMSLDRAPGETVTEHKARLLSYLEEN